MRLTMADTTRTLMNIRFAGPDAEILATVLATHFSEDTNSLFPGTESGVTNVEVHVDKNNHEQLSELRRVLVAISGWEIAGPECPRNVEHLKHESGQEFMMAVVDVKHGDVWRCFDLKCSRTQVPMMIDRKTSPYMTFRDFNLIVMNSVAMDGSIRGMAESIPSVLGQRKRVMEKQSACFRSTIQGTASDMTAHEKSQKLDTSQPNRQEMPRIRVSKGGTGPGFGNITYLPLEGKPDFTAASTISSTGFIGKRINCPAAERDAKETIRDLLGKFPEIKEFAQRTAHHQIGMLTVEKQELQRKLDDRQKELNDCREVFDEMAKVGRELNARIDHLTDENHKLANTKLDKTTAPILKDVSNRMFMFLAGANFQDHPIADQRKLLELMHQLKNALVCSGVGSQ